MWSQRMNDLAEIENRLIDAAEGPLYMQGETHGDNSFNAGNCGRE